MNSLKRLEYFFSGRTKDWKKGRTETIIYMPAELMPRVLLDRFIFLISKLYALEINSFGAVTATDK